MKNRKTCDCGVEIAFINGIPVECDKTTTFVTIAGNVYVGYPSHWERCPYADKFRKGKRPKPLADKPVEETLDLPGLLDE